METEITDIAISPEQESKEIATIAKASIANIEANKKAYEALRDEYKGTKAPELTDPEFKATLKKLTQGSGALVKARTAATKLGKQETDKLDKVKVMIKSAVEELIAITADTEKEIKAEKERAEQLVADEKAEKERQAEEAKQARIAKLYELGLTHNGSYYSLGDLSITPVQITQFTEAQFEGFVSQATVEFEAIKLKEAEEKAAEEKRISDEKKAADEQAEANRKAQEALARENEAKQKELDEMRKQQDLMRIQIAEHRVDVLKSKGFDGDLKKGYLAYDSEVWGTSKRVDAKTIVDHTKTEWDELIKAIDVWLVEINKPKPAVVPMSIAGLSKPLNGIPILEPVADNEYMDEVLAQPNDSLVDDGIKYDQCILVFDTNNPFIDTMVGKATLRVYTEGFLEAAQDGLAPEMVSATGHIGDGLLFMVIKPR